MSKIFNVSKGLLTINLDSFDEKGNRKNLYITPRNKSRELTEEEVASKEIADLLRMKKGCPIRLVN